MNKANVDWVSPLNCLEVYGSDALHTRARQKSVDTSAKVQSMQHAAAACAGGSLTEYTRQFTTTQVVQNINKKPKFDTKVSKECLLTAILHKLNLRYEIYLPKM